MKYIDFLWALDYLSRYYPKYHSHEILNLADDIWKWLNNELPENSSSLIYLKSVFNSPSEAIKALWKEIQLMAGPFMNNN
ncbi:hypothetical protein [Chryseosolibacter indicus]|uniref:Uncharacterized protein n=1 Tax=Chryseosolibacter indicus TaxID=2782351 RepID=A0ABS5VQT1_9BACT|nr:hypothetical protein [Chryseosolibacter indicus]MBT1702376.1 hypothetical protein [Chryseosolibacter indicus]